ncbi:hypothetical protein PGQ11_011262 [Apiospora arundinis]|uniref:F-box domain-containing protein n=1 Tax=Apiospora arundinis TaxID=335852 RepID=A0ABR2I048_9PEZI
MDKFSRLPTEILQKIGSLVDLRGKLSLRGASRRAQDAFYTDEHEQAAIWNLIFTDDREWCKKIESSGAKIVLVGADQKWIKNDGNPEYNDLVVTLVPIWPKGKNPYHRAFKHKGSADKEDLTVMDNLEEGMLRSLLSALRSKDYDKRSQEVRFHGFNVHIGYVLNDPFFRNLERLLLPKEANGKDSTLILYYNGGPMPMHNGQAELFDDDTILRIQHDGRRVVVFLESTGAC